MNAAAPNGNHSALIVLARYPQTGHVKTRLAATIGNDAATAIYRLCAERLFREARGLPADVRRYIFFAGNERERAVRSWVGDGFHLERQHGDDLGERIKNAFVRAFARGAEQAVIVGSDIPDLSATLIEQAYLFLEAYDVVIGPDHDGGYYLLGMKDLHEAIFDGVPWGTSRVHGQTLRNVRALGLSVAFLPVLIDVDTEPDLRRWLDGRHHEEMGELEHLAAAKLALR
jgi:rSAM/selenodomain-associated transferase 1